MYLSFLLLILFSSISVGQNYPTSVAQPTAVTTSTQNQNIKKQIYILKPNKNLQKITLAMAIKEALNSNSDIKILQERIKSQKHQLWLATSMLLPSISVRGQYTINSPSNSFIASQQSVKNNLNNNQPANINQKDYSTVFNASIRGQMPIFNANILFAIQENYLNLKSLKMQNQESRMHLILSVVNSYIASLNAKNFINIYKKQLSRAKDAYRTIKNKTDLGLEEIHSSQRAHLQVLRVEQQLLSSVSSYKYALGTLGLLLGRTVEFSLDNDLKFKYDFGNLTTQTLINMSLNKRNVVNQYKIDILKAKINKQKEALSLLPKITLSAQANYSSNKINTNNDHLSGLISIEASLPIFEGGKNVIKHKQNLLRQREMTIRLNKLKQEISSQVRAYLNEYALANKQQTISKKEIILARSFYTSIQEKYSSGLATAVQLMDSSIDLAAAQQRKNNADFNIIVSQLNLAFMTGSLSIHSFAE